MGSANPKEATGAAKPPMAWIPPCAEVLVSLVHQHGNEKHGVFNWRDSEINAMTYACAVRRHLAAWIDGQDDDPDTGLSHWAHIAATANVFLDALANGKVNDDRPPSGNAAKLIARLTRGSGQ